MYVINTKLINLINKFNTYEFNINSILINLICLFVLPSVNFTGGFFVDTICKAINK